MAITTNDKNLGHATAYAYAKSKGYTGTEQEFATLMASYGTVAESAEESRQAAEEAQSRAEAAKTAAETAQTGAINAKDTAVSAVSTATTKAGEASQSATAAAGSAEDSEAWAIGKRDGVDVPSTDDAYQNNSKYWANEAERVVGEANYAWFDVDQSDGEMYVTMTPNLDADLSFVINENTGELEGTIGTTRTYSAGIATAYGAALAGGYTGTYGEFCAALGDLANVLEDFESFSVTINTLPEGSSATASYTDGALTLGIPKGDTGNGIASAVLNNDYTLTLTFTDGTSYTTPSIRGTQGETGATGPTGATGATGNGIASITLTSTSGAVKTYTITFTDGTTTTFDVTDGEVTAAQLAAEATARESADSELRSALSDTISEVTVDKKTLVADEYVKNTDGTFASYGGWTRTDYLPCDNYTQIKLSIGSNYCAFYDADKAFIKGASFVANTYLDVPDNAAYFAVSGTTVNMGTLVINAMQMGMGYVLDERVSKVENVTTTEETVSADAVIDSYLINEAGNPVQSSDWVCTDFIVMPFDEVSGYDVHGTFYGIGGIAIYDASNQLLLAVSGNNVSDYGGSTRAALQTIHVPSVQGAKSIRISGWKTQVSSAADLWVKGNTFNGVYKHISDLESDMKAVKANVSTTISESKVLVLGDSISADAYGSYPKWVTDLINQGFLPSDTLNSSQHATGFVARYDNQPNDFITRLKAVQNPSQYDLVVVFGGIHDYIQNIPMGSDSGTDYTVSFKPAVNEFFNYLIQNFTQARLCVLLPLRTYATWQNSEGEYQQAYGDYIKQVAKSYCLPVLNLTEDSGFCPYISTFSDMWTLLPSGFQSHDGVHPNEEYERRFLAPMIKHFLQGML